MAYKMWKKGRHTDYKFIDGAIADQYNMGGVDMWLYTYIGPAINNNQSGDSTLDYNGSNGNLSKIGDLVFGETASRSYNLQAITLPVVYQIQEATPDLKIPGLFFNFDTMDITLHYNTMMQRVGRKIMPGDVLELPNLRDFDVIGKDQGINRFYVVQDSFRTAEGYSVTWQHHIFKLRVKPLTASPEFSDFDDNNDYPDNPDDPNNGNGNGDQNNNNNGKNELDIMNAIIAQADDEVPYIHWTNEHIYDDISDINELSRYIISDYEFPVNPASLMFFIKLTYPVLYEKNDGSWNIVRASYGDTLPKRAHDGDFFFKEDKADVSGYSLFQYYESERRWVQCLLPVTDTNTVPADAEDFYCYVVEPQMYQYDDKGEWVIPDPSNSTVPFTSKDIAANRTNPQDMRPMIPPARGSEGVGEGTSFPTDPTDGEFFYRTDLTPVTLWQYSSESSSWVQFNYGGRKPWVGPNWEQAKFINSDDRVSIADVVKPNTAYRVKKDK